ncbi:MAG TPA: MGMT family protein [Leptolyngbyaceae cyanobacterium M33_DOE_097]|uniref:Methylated-DNA-[protein]-cysteine S-methyltransferase DNA binding domain-containing protein n=1 Tax=Oscillatoriales cyanobacterium SpSt-418 TaxID=2282169 RepID=A0A7C3PSN2_9CYAN|nr:MGMT family protein [Leptolyngbyaceae cyanobacterium M33_DOE_097]
MAKSAAFARIKSQVLTLTYSIPVGRVSTYRSLGEHLDVMPRHVAYILTTLKEEEKADLPWYRVVSDNGAVSAPNPVKAKAQMELLAAEGVAIGPQKTILNFAAIFVAAPDLASGIPPQKRSHPAPELSD